MSGRKIWRTRTMCMLLACVTAMSAGCAVPQSQNVQGKTGQIVEPVTNRDYYLYLPKDYTPARQYPLVVSIHGMKPFDNAFPQLMTWRKICDENNWIAIAPQLRSPDMFNQFPFRNIDRTLLEDETLIVSAIHDVCRRCSVDTQRVMLTGWSSGGYLIHYIGARHPELFCLIAPQGSNFHEPLMPRRINDAARGLAVYVYHGENDLPVIVRDSNAAVRWYMSNGYQNVKMDEAPGGHARHPELAARYFMDLIRSNAGAIASAADGDAAGGPWLGQQSRVVGRSGMNNATAIASAYQPGGNATAFGPATSPPRAATGGSPANGGGQRIAPAASSASPVVGPASPVVGGSSVRLPPAPPGRVDFTPTPATVVSPTAGGGLPAAMPGQIVAVGPSGDDTAHFAPPRVVSAGPSPGLPADAVVLDRRPESVRENVSSAAPTAARAVPVPLGPAAATFQPAAAPAEPDRAVAALGEPDRFPAAAVTVEPIAPTLKVAAPTPLSPGSLRPSNDDLTPVAAAGNPLTRLGPTSPGTRLANNPAATPQAVPLDTSIGVKILPSVQEGDTPLTVEFRCELRGINNPIVRYRWSVDGSLFCTTHFGLLTFRRAGAYPVDLAITDSAGNTYRTRTTIRVNATN